MRRHTEGIGLPDRHSLTGASGLLSIFLLRRVVFHRFENAGRPLSQCSGHPQLQRPCATFSFCLPVITSPWQEWEARSPKPQRLTQERSFGRTLMLKQSNN